jgi:uncharacterized protein (DUF924 family)
VIRPDDVLQFWFGTVDGKGLTVPQEKWFAKNPDFDQACRDGFGAAWEVARTGGYDDWQGLPRAALALVVLLDQIPRNIFRGDPRSYATDSKALEVARAALANGFDENLTPLENIFLFLPFEHSEKLDDQNQSVALADGLPPGEAFDRVRRIARRHREIVERFGRFPHRNVVLGRVSTAEEIAFLQEPESSF